MISAQAAVEQRSIKNQAARQDCFVERRVEDGVMNRRFGAGRATVAVYQQSAILSPGGREFITQKINNCKIGPAHVCAGIGHEERLTVNQSGRHAAK